MRRLSLRSASLMAAVLVSAGCGASGGTGGNNTAKQYDTGGTFTMALPYDVGTMDIYHSATTFGVNNLAYDSLVTLMPDGKIKSGLAQKWEADAHQATFTLRPGITCSDGTSLTASQVAADLNYLGDPKNQSPSYGTYVPTVPFAASGDDATGVVKVVMNKQPFGLLLNSVGLAPIVCANGLKNPKMLAATSDGTGPYVLTSVVPGQSYTFTVRKGYTWGPEGASTATAGTPGKIVIKIVQNETTAANLLVSGGLNYAQISGPDHRRLTARGLRRAENPQASLWLFFNERTGHSTADQRVRQALIEAADLDEIVKVSTGGTGRPATGLVAMHPKVCTGNTEAGQLPKHDVAAAAALLDQDGWIKGSDGIRRKGGKALKIDVHDVPTLSAGTRPSAELLTQQWKAIGVQAELQNGTLADLGTTQTNGTYDVLLQPFDVNLPSIMVPNLSGPTPPQGGNFAGLHNAEYEADTAKAQTMVPPAACTYWNQAEQALFHTADVAPISEQPGYFFLNKADLRPAGLSVLVPSSLKLFR
jgi:peptide/nickel transport system substrate-binding protein